MPEPFPGSRQLESQPNRPWSRALSLSLAFRASPMAADARAAALESLKSVLPGEPEAVLLAALERARGNVDLAASALFARPKLPLKRSIAEYFGSADTAKAPEKSHSTKPEPRSAVFTNPEARAAETAEGEAETTKSALEALQWKEGAAPKKARNTFTNVILDTPELVRTHVPSLSIHHDFLPPDLADSILRFMMKESQTWQTPRYIIFERETESPHRSATYVTNFDEIRAQKQEDAGLFFGGRYLSDVRRCTDDLVRAKFLIEEKVNDLMKGRERHRLEIKGPWSVNTVLANSYLDDQSGVGPHTDRLTHIGPRPTIASLTLGACRVFKLRPMNPDDNPDPAAKPRAGEYPSYLVPLPHNSLLIMHPPTQEVYKHEIPKITSTLPALKRHPISGSERINLTFRCYRDEYDAAHTPACDCANKADLQCAFKRDNERYFYSCAGAGGNGRAVGQRCGFFRWLEKA
ncbi:hypothetical protein DFJ74DRAFT_659404 [Hyaloraphidium curvatum]|nr:hypothetical protein DFJ74DRAFT_659404 [Hyaloraphidium curvatum]